MAKQTEHNVGIYMRLSKDDERAGESLSIENQKLILTKYVMEQGWNLVSEYVDDGWSGTDFDRPGVQRLLEDAQTGKINTIVVKDLSRFGRNYIEVGRYVDELAPTYKEHQSLSGFKQSRYKKKHSEQIEDPRTVIPTHYGSIVGSSGDGETFRKLVNSDIEVILKLK